MGRGRDRGTNGWDPDTVMGVGEFDSNLNFKGIRIIFKFFQILTASKSTFLISKNVK
jgi:hypothetical protein